MAMKTPPGSISPPAGCRDQLQNHPRTRVYGAGISGRLLWKIMAASTFLGLMGFYKHRRGPRGCPKGRGGSHPRVDPRPRQGAAPGLWVAPQAPLWSSGVLFGIKNLRKFFQFREYLQK